MVKKDLNKALIWLKSAANNGHPLAQEALGDLFNIGEGVKFSPAAALKWWLKAADHNRPVSFRVYKAYIRGVGGKKTNAEAKKWIERGLAHEEELEKRSMIDILSGKTVQKFVPVAEWEDR